MTETRFPPGWDEERVQRTLARYTRGVTESTAEDDLLALCARHRLPEPQPQYRLGPYRWDFAWPAHRLVLDVDEYDGHRQLIPLVEDRAKDRHATTHGHRPLRVIDAELRTASAEVARDLREALASPR